MTGGGMSEEVKCDLCGKPRTATMKVRHHTGLGTRGGRRRRYTLYFCEGCETVFWTLMRDWIRRIRECESS